MFMPLAQGQICPALDVCDVEQRPLNLQRMQGAPVLLSFLREVNCGFCHRRIQELKQRAEDLQRRGLQIVAVIAGNEDKVRQYAAQQQLPFRVVADPVVTHRHSELVFVDE